MQEAIETVGKSSHRKRKKSKKGLTDWRKKKKGKTLEVSLGVDVVGLEV